MNHRNKFLYRLRKPNYKINLQKLEIYNELLNKRFNHFLKLLKVITNENIKIIDCKPIDNYNIKSYEIVKYEDTHPIKIREKSE